MDAISPDTLDNTCSVRGFLLKVLVLSLVFSHVRRSYRQSQIVFLVIADIGFKSLSNILCADFYAIEL